MKEGKDLIKDFYTVRDIAEQLQVKERAIRQLVSSGELKAHKICGKWIVTAENLKSFIDPGKRSASVFDAIPIQQRGGVIYGNGVR